MSDTPQIPQSEALKEALPESLSELFSRDPETHTEADTKRIVREMREQRKRQEAAEAAGAVRAPKRNAGSETSSRSAGDLGL